VPNNAIFGTAYWIVGLPIIFPMFLMFPIPCPKEPYEDETDKPVSGKQQ
jgi:hypothetical protein